MPPATCTQLAAAVRSVKGHADVEVHHRPSIHGCALTRDLCLGRFDDEALAALNLARPRRSIDTEPDSYPGTVRWAGHAHHRGAADGHGLDG